MLIPFFHNKTKEEKTYYAALIIGSGSLTGTIFEYTSHGHKIIGSNSQPYGENLSDFIEVSDQVISQAAGEIPLNQIHQVIFAVPPEYLDENKISSDKLNLFKKLTQELELKPTGFVVIPEAINFYLEKVSGGPQTNIVFGFLFNSVTATIFRGGKLSNQKTVKGSNDLVSDISQILDAFSDVDIFPSKIYIYGGVQIEEIKQELLKYPWQKNNKFLHLPKIEIIPENDIVKAAVNASASEITKDLKEIPLVVKPTQHESETYNRKVKPSSFGFAQEEIPSAKVEPLLTEEDKHSKMTLPSFSIKNKFQIISRIPMKAKILSILTILILALIAGAFFTLSYSLPKATVTLLVDPKEFTTQKEVSINPNIMMIDTNLVQVPGKFLQFEASGSKTAATSGTKLIGDPAVGAITIYNKTTSARTFEKGTLITANKLEFKLDDNIEVPNASETVEGLSYGKANVNVTAVKIGPEGNITSQSDFIISDFSASSYMARNEQAFSKGTSREINTVSKEDQDNLITTISDELTLQAKTNLNSKVVNGEKLLEESISGEISTKKFNHDVGSESKDLSLEMTMLFKGLVYKDSDFASLLEKQIIENIPSGYEYRPDQTSLKVIQMDASSSDGIYSFKAEFKAKLYPELNIEEIKKEIAGKKTSSLEGYFKQLTNVAGFEIEFKTPLSLFQSNLPKNISKIDIVITSR